MTVSSARSGNTGGTEQSWGKRAAAVVKRLRAPEPSRTVRLLVIADMAPELPSDVEGYLDAEAVDVVVLAGDLLSGDLRGLTQTSRPTLGVYGNHCDGQYLTEMGFTNLHLAAVEVAGVTFTGLEGCVRAGSRPRRTAAFADSRTDEGSGS
jgi:predicted phosphodiesterase